MEFVSDDFSYVHVAPQEVALAASKGKEVGLAQPSSRTAGMPGKAALAVGQVVGTGEGVVASEAELDELESMLEETDVNATENDDGSNELLDELEGELTDERSLP